MAMIRKYLVTPLVSGLVGFSVLFTMTVLYKLSGSFFGIGESSAIGAEDALNALHGFWIAGLGGLIYSVFGDYKDNSNDQINLSESQF